MRLTNTSRIPTDQLRPLLQFGARGCDDRSVAVHVKNTRGRYCAGRYYGSPPPICNVDARCDALIVMRFPDAGKPELWEKHWENTYDLKRLGLIYPHFPFDDWRDVVVWLTAHEFRHHWQAQRQRRARRAGRKVSGKGEHDAEKHSLAVLNKYRAATGRQPIHPIKQPNPFRREARCECQPSP